MPVVVSQPPSSPLSPRNLEGEFGKEGGRRRKSRGSKRSGSKRGGSKRGGSKRNRKTRGNRKTRRY